MSIPVKDGYYPTLKWAPPPYLTPKIPFNSTFFKRSISLPCIGMCAQYIHKSHSVRIPTQSQNACQLDQREEGEKSVGIWPLSV